MNFPMFLCSWNDDTYKFHQAIMDDTSWMAFIIALLVGGIIALIYYLIVGKRDRLANKLTWALALIVGLVINFFVTSSIIVGKPIKKDQVTSTSLVYKYSFFKSIKNHETQLIDDENSKYYGNKDEEKNIGKEANKLRNNIKKGKDIVLTYELSCLIWTLLSFLIVSYCVKNSTTYASNVPTYWPQKKI